MNIFKHKQRREAAHMMQPQEGPSQTFERCCLCGALTDVRVDAPVWQRKRYVPGAGQLCAECCYEVYGTDDLRTLPDFG